MASAECDSTPASRPSNGPRPASVETASAIDSATASVPATVETSNISASATPRIAAWAVASPK
jgi:hypothetical protein